MMPIKHLDIAVIGDEELVSALRLAGSSRYYVIKDDHDVRENVRKALAELIAEPDVGIVVMLEDYAQYVEDLLTRVRKGRAITPVIIEVPSKFGTKYPDVREYYRASIRASIGFEVEI
jgi:vacuolar-type H+-ATPase subunit F/Vma7